MILGTAAYMSPEQARGKSVDKRADIFAFGCVLYEMLTGKLAFDGETISDTMAAVLTREPDWNAIPQGTPRRLTFDGENDQSPAWTPDGRRVVWGSDRPGGRNFYWKRADGSGAEELLADVPGPFNDVNSVTQDGRWLVYTTYGGDTGEDIWIVDIDGKHEPRPLLKTKATEMDATVSPDNRWIVYRLDESGEFELYAQSFPALEHKIRLTINGAFNDVQKGSVVTRWRRDGREILFFSPDGRTVMSIPVTPGGELTAGAPVPLFKLPPEVHFVTPSPDGQKFYACVANQTFSRGLIRVVKNWAKGLDEAK